MLDECSSENIYLFIYTYIYLVLNLNEIPNWMV